MLGLCLSLEQDFIIMVLEMHACMCDEMAHWSGFSCSDLGSMVGVMTHFLRLAIAARGLRSDICMVKCEHFISCSRASQRRPLPRLVYCSDRCDREEFSVESLQCLRGAVKRNITTTFTVDLAGLGKKARDIIFTDYILAASISTARLQQQRRIALHE
jgi:hypothetical protein